MEVDDILGITLTQTAYVGLNAEACPYCHGPVTHTPKDSKTSIATCLSCNRKHAADWEMDENRKTRIRTKHPCPGVKERLTLTPQFPDSWHLRCLCVECGKELWSHGVNPVGWLTLAQS